MICTKKSKSDPLYELFDAMSIQPQPDMTKKIKAILFWHLVINYFLYIFPSDIPSLQDLALIYWGQDTMATILQTTFSNTFSSMKILVLRLKFQISFQGPNKQETSIGSDDDLVTSHYLNWWWPSVLAHVCFTWHQGVNSLAPGRFQFNIRNGIFKLTLVNGAWGISYEIAFRWMSQDLTDDKSTLVQVMAWCHQA